jgi:hypothetical protein
MAFLRSTEPSLLLIFDSSYPTVTYRPFDRGSDGRFVAYASGYCIEEAGGLHQRGLSVNSSWYL